MTEQNKRYVMQYGSLGKSLAGGNMKKIYIIGAGGFGRETAWLIERINSRGREPVWEIQGFLDDDVNMHGKSKGGYPVLGGCEFFEKCKDEIWAVCAIGAAAVRKKVIEKVAKYKNVKFATLLDPDAEISPSVSMGEGAIICAGSIITVDITIGRHVIININCTVGHDTVLADFVTLYPSVNVSGCVATGKCVEMGVGSQIIQGKTIGQNTIVGAGAVVIRDLPCGCTAVGVPAEIVKRTIKD